MKCLLCVLAAALVSTAGSAGAATVTLHNFDQGWYQNDGSHQVNNANIYVDEQSYVNFAAFDLSGLVGQTVTSANVTYAADLGAYNAKQYTDPFEVFDLYNFVGDIDELLFGNGGAAAFTDLGDGSLLGSANILTPLPSNF